jgi:formylglycine-generating enzyme required for sulfatase activity
MRISDLFRMKVVFAVFVTIGVSVLRAQTITNVTARQEGQELVISYNLTSSSPCEISLFISIDRSLTWQGPLTNCTGDVGKKINSGYRQIRWSVLDDWDQLVSHEIQFKVTAILPGNSAADQLITNRELEKTKAIEPEMVFVQGGRFIMGNQRGDDDEKPEHEIELNSFYIGRYEVTQAEWKSVMGINPSNSTNVMNVR